MFREELFKRLLVRGAVFLWHSYDKLDDPAVGNKPKYVVLLNAFLPDDADPLFYVLTTSQVAKLKATSRINECLLIPAGSYPFFGLETAISVASAGELSVDLEQFRALYQVGQVEWCGCLSDADVAALDELICKSRYVRAEIKRFITAW